jgi:outer membrane protein OmpA-like peptidoglycan-associated protein
MTMSNYSLMLALAVSACSAGAAEPVKIPLLKDMVVTTTVQKPNGDEEQILVISDATPVYVEYSVDFRYVLKGKPVSDVRVRRVRREDMLSSNKQNLVFQTGDALMYPGTTLGLSSASFAQLKTNGSVALVLGTIARYGEQEDMPEIMDIASGRKYFRGTLTRIEKNTVPIMVKINGKAEVVQTIHAKGVFSVASDHVDVELWVADNSAYPIGLRNRQGRSIFQTTRIDYPTVQPQATVLQQALSSGVCRTELNGIYFDFAKATLLPQSAPALGAVADLMKKNPSWNLRIEGHTDSVGGDAYNLDLSKRRAASVSFALSTQYQIPTTRFISNGFGASRPVAKNDTLEGRAMNRRVELARTCP